MLFEYVCTIMSNQFCCFTLVWIQPTAMNGYFDVVLGLAIFFIVVPLLWEFFSADFLC